MTCPNLLFKRSLWLLCCKESVGGQGQGQGDQAGCLQRDDGGWEGPGRRGRKVLSNGQILDLF